MDRSIRNPQSAIRNRTVRLCSFGTYERDFVRNRTIRNGLRACGWEVEECHAPVWERQRNKTGRYLGVLSLCRVGGRLIVSYVRLLLRYVFTVRRYDIMLVGYIGHLDLLLAGLLTRIPRRRPLVFDPLISLYDTLVADRAAFSADSLIGRLLWQLDRSTCRMADLVLLDTNAHIEYFVTTFHLPREKFVRVFVGAESDLFTPRTQAGRADEFRVLFVGKFTPLHGLPTIIQAAKLLETDPQIMFDIIGSGQLSDEVHQLAVQLDVRAVQFIDWVEYESLPARMAEADVCLGIFGTTDKADRVIPAKVFTALAMRKPLITGDSTAIRELLIDGESVVLCQRGDPEALSQAIRRLKSDAAFRERIADAGHRVYCEQASEARIGRVVTEALTRVLPVP